MMTVAQQVGLPLYHALRALSLDERLDRVKAMLDKVGLSHRILLKCPPSAYGGQQQRVGIATALIASPRFIIAERADHFGIGFRCAQRQIVDLLTSLVDDAGASMLIITHDFAVLARHYALLCAGRRVCRRQVTRLLQAPASEPARRLVDRPEAGCLPAPAWQQCWWQCWRPGIRESAIKQETFKNTAIMRKDDGNE